MKFEVKSRNNFVCDIQTAVIFCSPRLYYLNIRITHRECCSDESKFQNSRQRTCSNRSFLSRRASSVIDYPFFCFRERRPSAAEPGGGGAGRGVHKCTPEPPTSLPCQLYLLNNIQQTTLYRYFRTLKFIIYKYL